MNIFQILNISFMTSLNATSNNIKAYEQETDATNIYKLVKDIKENNDTEKKTIISRDKGLILDLIITFLKPYCAIINALNLTFIIENITHNKFKAVDVNGFLNYLINVANIKDNKLINLEEYKSSFSKFKDSIEQCKNESSLYNMLKTLINVLNELVIEKKN